MSIIERIAELEKKIEEQAPAGKKKRKPRDFRIPPKGKVSTSKARKGWVGILKINENGHWDFKRHQITDQTIMEDDIPRLAANQYVMFYKKMPVIILPTWSVEPFSPYKEYQKSLTDGTNAAGYKLLLSRMKTELVKAKKKIGGMGMMIFGLVIAGVIIYALISGGGG